MYFLCCILWLLREIRQHGFEAKLFTQSGRKSLVASSLRWQWDILSLLGEWEVSTEDRTDQFWEAPSENDSVFSTRKDSSGTCLVSACILLLPHASLIKGKYHPLILSQLLILKNTFCHLFGLSFCSWQNPKNSLFWDEEIRKFSVPLSDYILNLHFTLDQGGVIWSWEPANLGQRNGLVIFPTYWKRVAFKTPNHGSCAGQVNAGTAQLLRSDPLGDSQQLREIVQCFCFAVNTRRTREGRDKER